MRAGRIFARKGTSKLWCGYFLRGKEYRESTGTSDPKKAEKFLNRRLDQVGADREGGKAFAGPSQERVTVNQILDELAAEYKRGGRKRIPRKVSPQMKSHMDRLRDFFGSMRAMSVGTQHLNDFITLLKSEGKANATCNRSLQLLGQAYKVACSCDPPLLSRPLRVIRLDESNNVRKGKFTSDEARAIFAGLPDYLAGVARFAYETGARAGEILKLKWSYVEPNAILVPATDTKNRKARSIALTPELEDIIKLRKKAKAEKCDLIFHHEGHAIRDYRKAWHSVCVMNGLGRFYCRNCRDENHGYTSVLDANRTCPKCGTKWENPRYIGKLFHDFRRTAAHEMWKAGNAKEDCMEVTGHATPAMFMRYADLFTEEEKQARQREVQQRRRDWREAQSVARILTMPTPTRLAQ